MRNEFEVMQEHQKVLAQLKNGDTERETLKKAALLTVKVALQSIEPQSKEQAFEQLKTIEAGKKAMKQLKTSDFIRIFPIEANTELDPNKLIHEYGINQFLMEYPNKQVKQFYLLTLKLNYEIRKTNYIKSSEKIK